MTPDRQVIYALVSAGFHLVVLILGVASIGLVPGWWSVLVGVAWLAVTVVGAADWRRTVRLLILSIGLFALWAIGTLIVLS